MAYKKRSRDEHFKDAGPKRILALDGGGLRGIVTLTYLARVEDLLRARFGGAPDFRLGHYFDLIAGTSTGAIIAAALAKGLTVAEITKHYLNMGRDVFKSASWRDLKRRLAGGVLVPKYTKTELEELLKTVLGAKTTLGSSDLITGLLIVNKADRHGESVAARQQSGWEILPRSARRVVDIQRGLSLVAGRARVDSCADVFRAGTDFDWSRSKGTDRQVCRWRSESVQQPGAPSLHVCDNRRLWCALENRSRQLAHRLDWHRHRQPGDQEFRCDGG